MAGADDDDDDLTGFGFVWFSEGAIVYCDPYDRQPQAQPQTETESYDILYVFDDVAINLAESDEEQTA